MTKMIRLPVGADQEQSPPDLTTGNGIQSENICTEIPSLRESAPKPTIKTQEPSSKTAPALVDVVEQDIQNQRRTSHRLSTANRNDAVGTTSTLSSTRSINDQGNMRNSEQRMSASSDPSSTATSIICSLPLNKLESILGMLNGMKKNPDHTADLVSANAVLRDQDQNNSSPAGSDSTHDAPNDNSLVYKVLCLYCDRSFTNQKLMIKHTDRIHRIAKDRRSSARVLSTALNGSDVSSCCHFCHKGKTLNLMSENLPELFKHLISVHSDRYYACAHCTIRFPSDEAREAHMEALHPSTNSRRPKSKAALKAFSHGQNSCTLHHPQPVVSVVNCKTFKTAGVPRSEATEPLSTMLDLCSRSIDRLVVNNNSINNSSTKGESAVQNICLRSSLRNATAPTVEKDAANCKPKSKAFKKSERLLRRNSEPMLLSRLGITQHRLPRQSRRLLAAASTTANASLLSSDTTSASSISSTSSAMGSCLGKLTTKKKSTILASDDVQPVQNCYNKITKLKTIRSTLSTNPMVSIADGTIIETTDSGKVLSKGLEATTNGGAAVTTAGPTNETVGGMNNRGTMNNSSLTGNSIWCNSAGSVSNNGSNGSTVMLATNSGIFDEDFYETVTQNVKNNLSCHLDGKLEASTPYAPSPMSPVSVVPAVRSTVVKSPVSTDSKIHEATNLPTVSVMFPTLLTVEQYGTDSKPTTSTATVASVSSASSVKTKKTVTKNSWKWKWDFVKKYKYVNENGRIVKKIKQPTVGLRDLSKLDMWTQLTMRTKHELFQHRRTSDDQRQLQASSATKNDSAKEEPMIIAEVGATLRHEKRAMVEQLDQILDARLLPHIDLEQNDQRIIKIEPSDEHVTKEETPSLSTEPIDDKAEINIPPMQCSTLVPWSNTQSLSKNMDFLHNLQLIQLNRHHQNSPVVLSGEWARPRCYICYGCGAKFNSLKQVEEHRIFRHPHVHSTFYEIVGRELIEKRLYKHFFIPVIALMMQKMHCMRLGKPDRVMNSAIMHGMIPQHAGVCRINTVTEIKNEDSSSNEATSFSTSTSASSSSSSSSSLHSANTTVTTLMDTCSDAINVLSQCSSLAIDDEDEADSVRSVICSKCQKECQNQILLYAHILHCSNDYVWLQAKKRMKYRRAKRRRGGNRSVASCAPAMLTMPRMIQPQPNLVEKVDSIGYVTSVNEKHGLNEVVTSNSSLNNISLSSNVSSSSDSTCGSSSTSNNSSINSTDLSKVNSNQKVRRSPKPKENDSDIVKKLLANLPAKRNSRETNSPTSTQINKRSRVVGRKNFCSTTVSAASKSRGHETKLPSLPLGESVVAQPTPDNTAPVHNGNDNDSNKSLSTSSISPTKREIISHSTIATKLRTRQGLSSSSSSTLYVSSSNKTQRVSFKKSSPSSENTVNDANYKRSSKESALILGKAPEIRKKNNIKRGKLVGTINKNKMLMWKKGQKRQLVRVSTTNGHHRMLRSSGKRLLPLSVSIRQSSLSLRSIRHSTRGKNVSNKRKMLKKHNPLPPVVTFQGETLDEKESTTMVAKEDTNNDATEMAYDGSSRSISSNRIDSFLEAVALEKVKASNSAETEREDPIIKDTNMKQTVDNMQPLVRSRKSSTSMDFPHSATQVTPNQPIKKQCSKDPPATPTKCDSTQAENLQQSLSSYSGVAEPNEQISTSGGQSSGNNKPRKKKLNDCIAMLTGKLSQQLGVDFFNNEKNRGEVYPTESAASCSTSEPEKLVIKNTTTSSCSLSSDECSSFKEDGLVKEQNVQIHSMLPAIAPNNNSNTSSSVQVDTAASSTPTISSNEYRQALTALPPQTAPIRMKTVNSVQSILPSLATPLTFERLTTQLESVTEQIPDEPLNLSLNSPIGRGVIRNPKVQWKPDNDSSTVYKSFHSKQESAISANSISTQPVHAHRLKAENLVTHFNHLLGSSTHINHQKVRKPKCTSPTMTDSGSTIAPKMGAGNFSSLKLPPGLIIERVEYKQSRPSITKEVPSVTIVARQRQLPAPDLIPSITENNATDLTIEKPTPLTHSSNLIAFASNSTNFVKPLTNNTSGLIHHSDANHVKILGYGTYSDPNVLPRRSEPTTDTVIPMLPSVLRSGPCVENRISVTITESKSTVHERMQDVHNPSISVDLSKTSKNDKMVSSYCSTLQKSPSDSVQIRPLQRTSSSVTPSSLHKSSIAAAVHTPGSSEKTPPPMTTLIIPQVPMPPLSSKAMHPIKRARRKSVFVPLPVPTDESNRDGMVKPLRQQHPIIPTISTPPSTLPVPTVITSANLLASMSLSFIAPGLLPVPGTSMLGPIDMQRLAAVRLPAHLQPPVIPPLKIPDAATSATLLEKIFHPTHSDALSTGLELKTDAHCNQAKQPPSLQATAVRSHVYHNTAEENLQFISSTTAKTSMINGFVNQSEQICKINAIRTDGIRTPDTKIMKSNNSSAASKPSGRIMKRRASVADLQRQALMEQIWNQSIIDKMMHEKDARIVAGLDETSKAVETTTPTAEIAIEKSSNIQIANEPTSAHKGEHLETIAEGLRVHSSVSICAPDGNKTERQNKNECLLDLMSSKKMKIPENISKAISQNRHNVEEQHQHNTVAVALNVQEAIEAKLQNAQKENNVQLQNKPEDCNIALTHTVDNTNDSNTTLGQDHSIKGINPPASLSAIDTADMMKTVDKIDAASEDGSVDTIDCQVSADTQKPALKKIARKRRKNELASILSDQLLESFKEVDKSRLDDLKLLHDLTCETPDVKFTLEQIPQLAKRKSNPRLPELVMQETSNIKATSLNITTKKGQNTKRQPKEKEQISLSTVKEVKNKPSNDTIDSGEPNEVKSVQIQERKEDGFVNSGNDMKDKCALQNEPLETKKSTGDLGSSTEQELAKHKATRSKTQTTFSGEHGSHNSPRRSLTRATNSELNADVVANDRTADINIQDRKSLLRKRNIAPAAEIVQSCEKNNFTNSIDNAETANSLTGSNNRSTEMVSHKNVDTTPTPPIIAEKASSNPPKRIMSRRKSVFVDCDLALYVEKEEEKLKKESTNVSFKDDFMLTSRRGTRSQGQLGLDLVESLAEATMKPRDPRRRMLQKRREEEFNARENKIQLQIKNDPPIPVEEQTADVMEKQTKSVSSNSIAAKGKKLVTNEFDSSVDTNAKNDKEILFSIGTEGHAPLRRISARRASVCVRPLTDSKNVKGHDMSTMTALPEDDHLRDIGNEVKRIYKRRASIYQPKPDLQQEDKDASGGTESNRKESQSPNSMEEENTVLGKKKETTPQKSHNRRSKTPGPGDCKRRKQLPLNGTSEPLIESLLLHAPDSESNAPKRRTTKNSQIAETVSKLFNIQEEIMLIDSSRRKPRKVNFPSVSTQPELSVQEQQKETLDSTNEGTGMEKGIERCKGLSSYELPMVGNEGIEKKSPPHIPRKSFSFSNDEDESPKAIKKMVENIINNTTNSSNASTDYSDDDNMSLAYFAARNNAPVTNLGQSTDNFLKPPSSTPVRAMSVIADDESTTCTDALDDDMMSVTTEIPPSSNASRMGTSRVRRKRRKSRRQNSKIKRQQTKTQEENNKPVQSFNCILCRKMFKKHDAFNKHRMTLSHIAKLSEQEYLVSQQNQERRENKSLLEPKENIQLQPNPDDNQRTEKVDEPNANSMDAPELVPTTPNGNLAMASLQMKMTDNNKLHGNQSVKELSQEEKLFFECCSMLKESNAGESDELKRVTVSLETNELLTSSDSISPCVVFTDKSTNVSATGASVNLPLVEQNQTSPVSMTCCVEEFVATQVTNIRQQEQEGTGTPQNHERLREGANFMVQRYVVANVARNTSPHNSIKSSSTMPTATTSSSISSNSSSSTSSSSSRSSSCSDSNTVSKNNANNAKIKTKGALKGYDNFKVSIPMTGLTVMSTNTANTGVAVGKESRLDTLADVALCGDIPKEFGIEVQSHEINAATLVRVDERVSTCPETPARFPVVDTDMFIGGKVHVHSLKLIENNEKFCNAEPKTNSSISRASEQSNAKSMTSNKIGCVKNRECSAKPQNKLSNRWISGPYRRRTERNNPPANAEAALQCDHTFLHEGDDIYAFQDSPCDGDLPSTYSSKKNSNTMQNQGMMKNEESNQQQQVKQNATITASLEEHDDSQMSSLSFSDRDDFVYGTNTMSEEEEEEDDKNSSISSEQTTPKKLTNADVQKKSLIMGRIFKKGGAKDKFVGDVGVRKSSTTSPEEPPVAEVPHKAAGTPVTASKPATTLKSAVKDFDKLFDTLKNDAVSANELQNNNDTVSDIRHAASPGEEILVATMGVKDKLAECQTNNSDHPYHPGRNDFGTINTGTDRLRRRRAGQQKILTETWDSDEFEDIQKDDIMRLINRTEDDEVIDNTLSTRRIPLHKTTDEKTKSGNLECISTDRLKQSSSLNDISNNENHRIEQMLDKHAGSKQGIHSLFDKKPLKFDTTTVTDDTIRKVMESVILETMGKSCNSNKRKPTTAHAPTLGTDSTAASNSKVLRVSSNSDGHGINTFAPNVSTEDVSLAFEMTSLEEHTLEPSVVISSKTITSKFKQKLNSSMRYNLTEIEGVSDSYEKEPMSRQSKLATNTSSISDTNSGTNIKLATNNSKNNNNNKNINNNNNSKLSVKSSKPVTGTKNKPKCTEEDWIGKTPVASGKQRKVAPKKMKNIAYDPDSDYEQSIKCKKVKRKLLENDIEANLKIEQLQSTLLNVEDSSILLTTPRRKRNAGDMLYYWSSSSDEEIEKEEKTGRTKRHGDITEDRRRHCKPINNNNVTVGKKRGRKKKQTQLESMNSIELITDDVKKQDASDSEKDETKSKSTLLSQPTTITTEASLIEVSAKKSRTNTGSTDKKVGIVPKTKKQLDTERSLQIQTLPVQTDEETCGTSSEHLQQHGWIMGDSHKKLVTMLAHAKGKHDSRKQSTTNRKK